MTKVGIIGSGFGLYGLLPAFSKVPDVEVVAYVGQVSARAEAACNKYRVKHQYQEWSDMVARHQLDAVALGVTPPAQAKIIPELLEHNLHIFAEKPLAPSLEPARFLSNLADQKKITHAIDFIFPELATWQAFKKLLTPELIAAQPSFTLDWSFLSYDIKNGLSTWKTDPSQGGGVLSFYFCHSLYYLEWLFGPIARFESQLLYSTESIGRLETGCKLKLIFKNGISGEASINCNNQTDFNHSLKLKYGETSLELSNQSNVATEFKLTLDQQGKIKDLTPRDLPWQPDEDERCSPVFKLAQRFIVACQNRQSLSPSFHEGVRVQELIEEIRTQS